MNYEFPKIYHIDEVREAIAGREEFIEANKGDYIVFNYLVNFEDTFPPVFKDGEFDKMAAIRRECRGLIFDAKTGEVIARRYHKFFNMGEKAETSESAIDWLQPHLFLEKLDGSMITPFMTSDQAEIFGINYDAPFYVGTKMGETEASVNAKAFIMANKNYVAFIRYVFELGYTPIFEWCSRKNRIVIDYPEDRLVLTAIRENLDGHYLDYHYMLGWAEEFGIECVKAFPMNIHDAKLNQKIIKDEGYVVRFNDGHMIKIKGEHYLMLHKTMEHLTHEKDLIRLILEEKLDDAKAFIAPDVVSRVEKFGHKMFYMMRLEADRIAWDCIDDYDNSSSKKEYALKVKDKEESGLRFKLYDFMAEKDGADQIWVSGDVVQHAYELIKSKVLNSTSSQGKVDSIRNLIGNVKWDG